MATPTSSSPDNNFYADIDVPYIKGQPMGFIDFLDERCLPPEVIEAKKAKKDHTWDKEDRDPSHEDHDSLKETKKKSVLANTVQDLPDDVKKMLKKANIDLDTCTGRNYEILLNVLRFACKQTFKMDKNIPRELQRVRSVSPVPVLDTFELDLQAAPSLLMKTDESMTVLNDAQVKKMWKGLEFEGKGGFGKVFFAIQNNLKEQVALKKMSHTAERDILANLSEIGYLKACNHPNIVKFLGAYKVKKEAWLVMEYMEGGTLNEAVKNFEFKESHIAFVAQETLKGIKYMHDRKWAHRDLKSNNIMMTVQGEVKLIDFGLCVDVSNGPKSHMVGSPFWMPPEMIRCQQHGIPVDIWSFAVCMLEMVNRAPPFKEHKVKALYVAGTIGLDEVVDASNISSELKDFLHQCLRIDPAERATADALLKHPFLSKADTQKSMKDIIANVFISRTVVGGGIM